MLLMITLLAFSQITMEISVYGFMVNQRNIKMVSKIHENLMVKKNIEIAEQEVDEQVKEKVNEKIEETQQTSTKVYTKDKADTVKTQQSVFLLSKPVNGGVTSSCFGETVDRSGPHIGHDWAVNEGTKVMAGESGIVEKAYFSDSYGYNVLINHRNGIKTRYAHLSQLNAKKGDLVSKGEVIGLSGNTGASTGPHLHFEVIVNGIRVNPLNYLE